MRSAKLAASVLASGLVLMALSGAVFAAAQTIAPEVPPLPPPQFSAKPATKPEQSESAAKLFSQQVLLRGTLGTRQIQMRLQPHPEFEGSVQGGYFEFGQSQKIALAGEYQDDQLSMEESVNGTNVSGQWNGSLIGNTYSGNWYAEDESSSIPFVLTVTGSAVKR